MAQRGADCANRVKAWHNEGAGKNAAETRAKNNSGGGAVGASLVRRLVRVDAQMSSEVGGIQVMGRFV
jgi:hypothetical protein